MISIVLIGPILISFPQRPDHWLHVAHTGSPWKQEAEQQDHHGLPHLAKARIQQRDMLMKDEEEALVSRVVSMPLSRSLVFSSSSICLGTLLSSSLI